MARERKNASIEDIQNALFDLAKAQERTEEAQKRGEERLEKLIARLDQNQQNAERDRKEAEKARKEEEKAREKARREEEKAREKARREEEKARRESEEELRKSIKGVNKKYGNLSNNWGDMLEGLLEGDLLRLLREWNINLGDIQPNLRFPDGELDLVAANGEEIVAVETKTTLRQNDIDDFLERLKKFKRNPSRGYDDKTIYGGMGFIKGRKETIKYAEKKGLFVIRCTGGDKNISTIVNSKGFRPRKI